MITYVAISCDKGKLLTEAQLNTCLFAQRTNVLGDEDQLDRDLKLISNGRKTLRWWANTDLSSDFYMFIDDDTWVFTDNIERVCKKLDADTPFLANYSCAPWGCVNVSNEIFGIDGYPQKTTTFLKEKVGKPITWHGGAGMIMSRALAKIVRDVIVNDSYYAEILEMIALSDELKISDGADKLWGFVLPQDLVMLRAMSKALSNIAPKKEHVRCLMSLPEIRKDGTRNYYNDHPWTNESGVLEKVNLAKKRAYKAVADFNPAFPGTKKDFFAKHAVRLSLNHKHTGFNKLHILEDEANLCTWHRIKKPEMFFELQRELDVLSEPLRANGDCLCDVCGKEYKQHAFSEHRSFNNEPFLNVLCDGSLVKL